LKIVKIHASSDIAATDHAGERGSEVSG